jgi:hypothetical protein
MPQVEQATAVGGDLTFAAQHTNDCFDEAQPLGASTSLRIARLLFLSMKSPHDLPCLRTVPLDVRASHAGVGIQPQTLPKHPRCAQERADRFA